MAELFTIVEAVEIIEDGVLLPAEIKLGRTLKKVLCVAGVTVDTYKQRVRFIAPEGCFTGLKELARISRAHMIPITEGPKEDKPYLYFSHCVFEPSTNWTALLFDQLLHADGRLIWMCGELEKRGYKRVDCHDGKVISLDYVKQHGKKEEPMKKAWAERTHSGISLTYEELRYEPCFLWIRMPMFKMVLEHADEMPQHVVDFIEQSTKTCNGCRYCVQTDRTKTRPLAFVKLGNKNKCPYFPGFTMNWRELSQELAENIVALLDAIDAQFS